jgi:uncharacterized protein (DUF1330 family)
MSAYLVVDITSIHDPGTYAEYRALVSQDLHAAGGIYLVRGGPIEVLEGGWRPGRLVIVKFDSREDANRWWASPGYARLKQMRQASTQTNMILVDGIPRMPEGLS